MGQVGKRAKHVYSIEHYDGPISAEPFQIRGNISIASPPPDKPLNWRRLKRNNRKISNAFGLFRSNTCSV